MAKRNRRAHGEGSIYRRKDGRWCGVIELPVSNGTRTRKSIYGKTAQEVVERMADARKSAADGCLIRDDRQRLGVFLDTWLEACEPTIRPTTFRRYSDIVRLHIKPELGHIRLTKLTAQQVQLFINRKVGSKAASKEKSGRPAPKGLSARTVQHILGVLRTALGRAKKWGLLNQNVATHAKPPRVERHEVQPFGVGEAQCFVEAVQGHRLEALFTVAIASGLRMGEALGLRWEDIDLDARTLHVRRSLQRNFGKLSAEECDNYGIVSLVEPKTVKSRRIVAIPKSLVASLKTHRSRQQQERLVAGTRWVDSKLVFTTTIGTPIDQRNIQEQFKRVLKNAGLRKQRFHDLRHAAASLLLAKGASPREIMDFLGHSQFSITMDLYTHLVPEVRRATADRMDEIFGKAADSAS